MIDRCGRNIDYLRISVTDRCNLRCIYCMPEEGIRLTGREKILQEPEIIRVCQGDGRLGIKKIKITGGEPLVRRGCDSLIREIKQIEGIDMVTLTTKRCPVGRNAATAAGSRRGCHQCESGYAKQSALSGSDRERYV